MHVVVSTVIEEMAHNGVHISQNGTKTYKMFRAD
jgi:hypothetical protein